MGLRNDHTGHRIALPRALLAATTLSIATALGSAGHAQDAAANKAAAEALFKEGLKRMEVGDYASACPKLEESLKLDRGVGTLLYLAECYERQGRTASAWAMFSSAASAARAAGQAGREKTATDRAAALEPKLGKLTITLAPDAELTGLEVKRDDVTVGGGSLGIAVPVDPGEHTVTASAPGRKAWSQTVRVDGAGGAQVTVPVLAVEPSSGGPGATGASVGPSTAGTGGAQPAADAEASGSGTAQLVAGGIITGVGVVGIVLGGIFGAQAKSKESDSEAYCRPEDPTRCTLQGVDLLDEGRTAATIGNVGFIAGGVLIAGGVVLMVTAPFGETTEAPASADAKGDTRARARSARRGPSVELAPLAGAGVGGLLVQGAW